MFSQQIQQRGQHAIRNYIPNLIAVDRAEAIHFACNAVVLSRDIVLPEGCPKLYATLAGHGFRSHALPMTEFIKAGGAC